MLAEILRTARRRVWLGGNIGGSLLDGRLDQLRFVELLRRKGFRAHRMEDGVVEWRARGWRVKTGAELQTIAPS